MNDAASTHANHSRQLELPMLALLLSGALLGACGQDDASGRNDASISEIAEEAVMRLAEGDVGVAEHFASDYVDHRAGTSGTAALRERLATQLAQHPDATVQVYRVLTEQNQVFVHSHVILDDGTLGSAAADVFRFEGDQIVEYWGNRQEVPATTASGNDMFSTLSAPVRFDPDPEADPAVTASTMAALSTALAVEKDLSAWDRYTLAPYYQHSVNTPNGIEAVKQIWGPIIADPTVAITPVMSITEGDLFVTMNLIDSPTLHLTTVDLSRVRDGLVVEHWDVVESR